MIWYRRSCAAQSHHSCHHLYLFSSIQSGCRNGGCISAQEELFVSGAATRFTAAVHGFGHCEFLFRPSSSGSLHCASFSKRATLPPRLSTSDTNTDCGTFHARGPAGSSHFGSRRECSLDFLRRGWCAVDIWIEVGVASPRSDQFEMSEMLQVIDERLLLLMERKTHLPGRVGLGSGSRVSLKGKLTRINEQTWVQHQGHPRDGRGYSPGAQLRVHRRKVGRCA